MRKDYDKKKRRMVYIIAFIIVGVMVLSSFGIILEQADTSSKKNYNGYSFVKTDNGGWLTKIKGNEMTFSHSPSDLEGINLSQTVRDVLNGKTHIGLTSDVNDPLSSSIALEQFDYAQTLPSTTNTYTTTGFTANNTYGKPVFGCNASNENTPVIYFKKARESSIRTEGSCVIVTADSDYEMVAMGERLLYYMMGIMKE